jgi:23S rRNA pseudouridine1911/1915/1917 synthase
MSEAGETITVKIPEEETQELRLDKALSLLHPDLSRSRLKVLILDGDVIVSGYIIKTASHKVKAGDEITLKIPPPVEDTPRAENIPLDIVYEDDDLLVINKAVGMVVHPAVGNTSGTLVNALLYHCKDNLSGIGGVKRPGIVHRLDKETSGLMVVAKNDLAHQGLSDQLQDRTLSRVYSAFVWRAPTLLKGKVDMPIGRHSSNRLKMAIMMNSGRDAVTHYHVQEKYGDSISLVDCKLESGRTHQIRVHMQHIKHPLIGDPLYGLPHQEGQALLKKAGYEEDIIKKVMSFDRQALHAREIGFIHPRTEEEMRFNSDMPDDLLNLKNLFKTIG